MSNGATLNSIPPRGRRSALVVVDVQNDFCGPNGSLKVPDGEQIIPVVNSLREKGAFSMIVLTQDWHPAGHISFLRNHLPTKDLDLFETTTISSGSQQIMWPQHCVQGGNGADFHPDLIVADTDSIIQKGRNKDIDSYSGFYDNDHQSKTDLSQLLSKNNITDVYIAGLATDYCVGYTALDSIAEGFTTFVIQDAVRGVIPSSTTAMLEKLEQAGVTLISSSLILEANNSVKDQRRNAALYLEQHSILPLFQRICAQLVYHKPEDPNAFIIEQLQKVKSSEKGIDSLSLFNEDDSGALFSMLDPLGKGEITGAQASKTLPALGLDKQAARAKSEAVVTKDQFVAMVAEGV